MHTDTVKQNSFSSIKLIVLLNYVAVTWSNLHNKIRVFQSNHYQLRMHNNIRISNSFLKLLSIYFFHISQSPTNKNNEINSIPTLSSIRLELNANDHDSEIVVCSAQAHWSKKRNTTRWTLVYNKDEQYQKNTG